MILPIYFPQQTDSSYHEVWFKIGENGPAIITSKWGEIVQACKLKKNDISIFNFSTAYH
jgi:hypothetical protein